VADGAVRTFDGHTFGFVSAGDNCEYLLAADLARGRFSLTASYVEGVRTHISINFDNGKHVVRVYKDLKVLKRAQLLSRS
jgi:hypothetical protein